MSALLERYPASGFALRMILHNKLRLVAALCGISFAVLFMFMQLTFLAGLDNTATAVVNQLDCDLALVSDRYLHLGSPGAIERTRLSAAKACAQVQAAIPLYCGYRDFRGVGAERDAKLFVMGVVVGERAQPFRMPEVAPQLSKLELPDRALIDLRSQDKCGDLSPGGRARMGANAFELVGGYTLGIGFFGAGSLITSDETWAKLLGAPLSSTQLGLIKLTPGADPLAAQRELRELLPSDTRVLTRAELIEAQRRYWVADTAIGNVFGVGTFLGFCVGFVVMFQILSTDVTNHLAQFATLKAMGYPDLQIQGLVLRQALLLGTLAYLPAFAFTALCSHLASSALRLPMDVTPLRAGGVFALTLGMCGISSLVALRRLERADPADLF